MPVESLRDVEAATADRRWVDWAVARLHADARRSADTHLLRLPTPAGSHVDLYLKDESTHPTGSLKHRLARSLFLYAICNGDIDRRQHRGGGLQRVDRDQRGVLRPAARAPVRRRGGPVDESRRSRADRARGRPLPLRRLRRATSTTPPARLADELGGHYLDQFTNAERATDWRGNNNIAESIFDQMAAEPHPVPAWIVVGAGTGGTSATIGRYLRYRGYATRSAVVDPEGSAFLPAYAGEAPRGPGSRIEGIGRPRVEPSFLPRVVDRMIGVPDAASVAAMHFLADRIVSAPGRRPAPTSTALCGWPASCTSTAFRAASSR